MNLAGRWVLITGASSGFGAAAAVAFGAQRARLLLGARRVDRMSEVAGLSLKAGAGETHFHAMDVSRPDSVTAFADWVKKKTGRVDVLINNAGGAHGLDPVATATDAGTGRPPSRRTSWDCCVSQGPSCR